MWITNHFEDQLVTNGQYVVVMRWLEGTGNTDNVGD